MGVLSIPTGGMTLWVFPGQWAWDLAKEREFRGCYNDPHVKDKGYSKSYGKSCTGKDFTFTEKKICFTVGTITHWSSFSEDIVLNPSLEIFKR